MNHRYSQPEDRLDEAMSGSLPHRSRPIFANLKNRLHLDGVNALLEPTTRHLTEALFKRMLSAWQNLDRFQVFGFVHHSKVVALLALEEQQNKSARVLSLAVTPSYQGRGLGHRLVVETFCTLQLSSLTARSLEDTLPFYESLNFAISREEGGQNGLKTYSCVLTREALYSIYEHEYSAGAVLYCVKGGKRLYVLVTELSGNTGLPKGHVEEGEREEETALREINEETGLIARIEPGFGGEIVYPQGRGMLKHFTYFLASFDASQSIESGVDVQAHLLPYEQAIRKLSFTDVRIILKNAEDLLSQKADLI